MTHAPPPTCSIHASQENVRAFRALRSKRLPPPPAAHAQCELRSTRELTDMADILWYHLIVSLPVLRCTSPLSVRDIPGTPHSVHVLLEGYSREVGENHFEADGSVTLVRGPLTVLVDTAGPWFRDSLIESLRCRGVTPGDVTHVICTHGHSDHVGNLNLFPKAEILVSYDLWRDGVYIAHDFRGGVPYRLPGGEGLKVVATPGHTGSDITLLVPGTSMGTVAVAGDLFEREDDEVTWRQLSENPTTQEKNRRELLKVADVIVPGHGPPFRIIRNQK
ncbi:LOW QUALITY PROTEIN: metallo-beta-lactamase domain-containing protein 1 [Pelodytes ibericus]